MRQHKTNGLSCVCVWLAGTRSSWGKEKEEEWKKFRKGGKKRKVRRVKVAWEKKKK